MNRLGLLALAIALPIVLHAESPLQPNTPVQFNSPNGVTEECRKLSYFPGGEYSKGDLKKEDELCSLDFYNTTQVALCPKTWSTSPGTMVYDPNEKGLDQDEYEKQPFCGGTKKGHKTLAKFKQTMSEIGDRGTSGTYAPSSWLYYHLSRYLDAETKVPPAVYRSMDRKTHFDRVTEKAHGMRLKGEMIRNGWYWLYTSEQNPETYHNNSVLFTDQNKQIFGMMADGGGIGCGAEFCGTREGGWGLGQAKSYQRTPAFLALKSDKPLREAIAEGLKEGQKDKKIRAAMGGGASDFQMAAWMQELTEITILDYILTQQDRVGNIDFDWYIYWQDAAGEVHSKKVDFPEGMEDEDLTRADMARLPYPKEVDGFPTQFVQRTRLNDNDAGARVYGRRSNGKLSSYANFTKQSEMLQGVRHISQSTYERLMALNADLQGQGPVYQIIRDEFMLNPLEIELIVTNTKEAAEILEATNAAGKLRFDLDKVKALYGELVPNLSIETPR